MSDTVLDCGAEILSDIFTSVSNDGDIDIPALKRWCEAALPDLKSHMRSAGESALKKNSLVEHSIDVGVLIGLMTLRMNWKPDYIVQAMTSGLLHDIGKLDIPDVILYKPGVLSEEEMTLVRMHTIKGSNILVSRKVNPSICDCALFHHELLDGSGYPFGLKLYSIPVLCRITAVADVYSSLREERVYRHSISNSQALSVLAEKTPQKYSIQSYSLLRKIVEV